jgi:acyl carrier protein
VERIAIEKAAARVFARHLMVDVSEVQLAASFAEDLGADSLDVYELAMEMEETFAIVIPDEEADGIRTVGAAYDYIEAKLAQSRK